jgi:hypothetical protein
MGLAVRLLVLLDSRQLIEVSLHALGEVVAIGAHDLEL